MLNLNAFENCLCCDKLMWCYVCRGMCNLMLIVLGCCGMCVNLMLIVLGMCFVGCFLVDFSHYFSLSCLHTLNLNAFQNCFWCD